VAQKALRNVHENICYKHQLKMLLQLTHVVSVLSYGHRNTV